ncbi:MAG: hypothetical protein ABIG46_01840 [Candidatus Omnitrophota bacterium]
MVKKKPKPKGKAKKTANRAVKGKIKRKVKRVVRKKISKRPAKKRIAGKRLIKKKVSKKKPALKSKAGIIGKVTHYFPRVKAAAIKLKAPLAVGDRIKIKGHTTDFTQAVDSLQVERTPIAVGKRGQEIGLLVSSRVRRNDSVYKA